MRAKPVFAAVLLLCAAASAAAAAANGKDVVVVGDSLAVREEWAAGRSLLHGGEDHDEDAAAVEQDAEVVVTSGRSYTWLKWVAAAVLFVEAYVGVALPYLLRITPRAQWFLSLLNAFAGGVFFTFGIMHLLMDSVSAQEEVNFDRWPIAGFFVGIGFFTFFFLQKVLAPSLGLGHTHNTHVITTDVDAESGCDLENKAGAPVDGSAAKACCKDGAPRCACGTPAPPTVGGRPEKANLIVEGCGCNGNCDDNCANCTCAAARKNPVTAVGGPYLAPGVGQPRSSSGWFRWDLVSPVLVMLGVLVHAILEGLAIGLSHTYGDVVTAFVAMATHKWVESIAISARFMKAGASMTALMSFLLPFSIGPLIGIIIGVKVANDNPWSDLVLFGFVAGLFIYVGTCEITAEEFAALDTPEGRMGKPTSARFWLFGALFFGFTVVALLQLVPGN